MSGLLGRLRCLLFGHCLHVVPMEWKLNGVLFTLCRCVRCDAMVLRPMNEDEIFAYNNRGDEQ